MFIYYAIQLPCHPNHDFNVGFYNSNNILRAMHSNYGKEFHFEDRGTDPYGKPVRYVVDVDGVDYARVVCIAIGDLDYIR